MLAVSRGVHGELEVLEAVVLGEEGHEGGECVGGRGRVGEDLGEVWFPALGAGDVLGYGDLQGRGLDVAHGHVVVGGIKVGDGRGGRRGGGRGGSY